MARYAEETKVPVEDTKAEIERTISRYGATAFAAGWQEGRAAVQFDIAGRRIRFVLPLPDEEKFALTATRQRRSPTQRRAAWEQGVRSAWRALLLVIKAKLESVESGVETTEEAFMAQIVLPSEETIGEWLKPQIERAYRTQEMPPMLPGMEPRPLALPERTEAA